VDGFHILGFPILSQEAYEEWLRPPRHEWDLRLPKAKDFYTRIHGTAPKR